jgi:stalled ribosome alternative rescue factor ArfA
VERYLCRIGEGDKNALYDAGEGLIHRVLFLGRVERKRGKGNNGLFF